MPSCSAAEVIGEHPGHWRVTPMVRVPVPGSEQQWALIDWDTAEGSNQGADR